MEQTAETQAPPARDGSPRSRLVKAVPRPDPMRKSAKELGLAGVYRVIHGSIEIVRPDEEWHYADGSVNYNEPSTVRASCVLKYDKNGKLESAAGDEVWLNDEDAYRLLAMDHPDDVPPDWPEARVNNAVVEALDAKPSRCGKVWKPPAITQPAVRT